MNVPKEGPGPAGSTGFGENLPPATGGSEAPPFAPGGPYNPYPPSAGMPPPNVTMPPGSAAMQPGFMGSGAPGSQGIPGQTSGPGARPGQYPMPTRQPPYGPQPGAGPMGPMGPQQQQQSGIKPRGVKTIPPPEGKHPPKEPPQPPGQWITVDAGKGQPPAYGFLPHESDEATTDTGLGEEPEKKQQQGQKPAEQKGHYVALQMPRGQGPDKDDEPTWCWIPEIGSDYGLKKEEKESGAKPSPKS